MKSQLILTIEDIEISKLESLKQEVLKQFPQFIVKIRTDIPSTCIPIYKWVKSQKRFPELFIYPNNFSIFYADDIVTLIRKKEPSYLYKLNGRYYIDDASNDINIDDICDDIINIFSTCLYKKGWLISPHLSIKNINKFLDNPEYLKTRQSRYLIIDNESQIKDWHRITFDFNNSKQYTVQLPNQTITRLYPEHLYQYLKVSQL